MLRGLRSRFTSVLAIFVLSLLVVGCSSKKDDDKTGDKSGKKDEDKGNPKVTKENFKKLKDKMTEKEVIDILGEPADKKDDGKRWTWKNGNYSIVATFTDGKLALHQEQEVTVTVPK